MLVGVDFDNTIICYDALFHRVAEEQGLLPAGVPSPAVGPASGPAEAFGIRAGMRLGEALARCPGLILVPPDIERTEALWERALRRLEGIGAAVESARPGEAL